eukprot:COSAG05_NODE_453_length_9653_cov_21.886749_6_plen_98_part_00
MINTIRSFGLSLADVASVLVVRTQTIRKEVLQQEKKRREGVMRRLDAESTKSTVAEEQQHQVWTLDKWTTTKAAMEMMTTSMDEEEERMARELLAAA